MRILIAGGAGFLGTNLTRRLLREGHRVTVLDNFVTGKKENLADLAGDLNLQLIEQDIVQVLPDLEQKLDVVVNMACPASPPAYQGMPLETLRVCSLGTENLLKLAVKSQARFVHASTSEVYGDPLIHPQKENYWGNVNPYGARSMYDEGKRYAESLIWVYRRKYGLNSGIVRIFNTYGPYMRPDDGRVITNFLRQGLKGEPLTVYGDGTGTRSFCFMDDQIEGWMKMIQSGVEGPINIGNADEFSIMELAEKVSKLFAHQPQIVFKSKPADDPARRRPDISKAKELLGWEPKIPLEEGLKLTLQWLKSIG